MTVYLVQASKGQWDDYASWIVGIFTTEEQANKAIKAIVDKIEADKTAPCPIQNITSYKDLPDYSEDTKKIYDIFDKWNDTITEAKEFNKCWIKEIELNKIL